MNESILCENCGGPLPQTGGLAGACPRCILDLALESTIGKVEGSESSMPGLPIPTTIARYRILRVIGEGAMGTVYEAEQDQPRRTVALKIIKPGISTPELQRRFEQESQALGRLQHPGIAQIYEAGTADTGFGPQPYFAMELIRGKTLSGYAKEHHLNTRQRLEMVARIAEAVQHAHLRGLIHRDLKPGNIMVDETGHPKVLDFGIARATDSDRQATSQTDMGQLVGTLAYMSPEQVLADPLELDTRSDVYSLGVILYELLAGRLPYPISKKLDETIHAIKEEDPARLSTVNRSYRGDIETIVARTLEKDKTRRYGSAAELAADIQRYLHDEPIVARPPSTSYQLRKFLSRHRALVVGVAAVLLALVAGLVVSTHLYLNARVARNEAEWGSYIANLSAADSSLRAKEFLEAQRRLELCASALRGWEWSYLSYLADQSIARLGPVNGSVDAVAFAAGGQRIIAQTKYEIDIWDTATRKLLAVYRPVADPKLDPKEEILTVSADGAFIVSTTWPSTPPGLPADYHDMSEKRTLRVRETVSGKLVSSFGGHPVSKVAFRPDGKYVVSSTYLKDDRGSPTSGDTPGSTVNSEYPHIWEALSGRLFMDIDGTPHDGPRTSDSGYSFITFAGDGKSVVGSRDNVLQVWDAISGNIIHSLKGHTGEISGVAISPDGSYIASGSSDKTARIWDAISGEFVRAYGGHEGSVDSLAVISEPFRFATASGKKIRIWNMSSSEAVTYEGHGAKVDSLAFSPDGMLLASGSVDQTVRLWAPVGLEPFREVRAGAKAASFSSDGKQIAVKINGSISLWDPSLKMLRSWPDPLDFETKVDPTLTLVFSPDGSRLAAAGGRLVSGLKGEFWDAVKKTEIDLWDVDSGKKLGVLSGHHELVNVVRFTPDGLQIVSASLDKTVKIWDAVTKTLVRTLSGHSAGVYAMAISVNGKTIASGSADSTIRLWDRTSGELIRTLEGHADGIISLSFGPDGRLVSGSRDGTIRVWDIRSGATLAILRGHEGWVTSVGWSPDQRRIVSGSMDSTVRLWDATRYEPVLVLRVGDQVRDVTFSPSGNEIIAITDKGNLLKWQER